MMLHFILIDKNYILVPQENFSLIRFRLPVILVLKIQSWIYINVIRIPIILALKI